MTVIGGLILYLILFAIVLFLAYVVTKYIGAKTTGNIKTRNIQIVETLALGFDRQVYLVKVGEQLMLLSSSNKTIQFLTLLDNSLVKLSDEDLKRFEARKPEDNVFKNYFDMFRANSKTEDIGVKVVPDMGASNFNQNLSKIKNIFSKINSEKSEDEKANE